MSPNRRWLGGLLVALSVAGAAGIALSVWMLSRWTDLRAVGTDEAAAIFAAIRSGAGDAVPYVEIAADGSASVRRDLELREPATLTTLHMMAFDPDHEQLVRIDLPWWFVRAKMTDTLNFGTLSSALARDWRHLDLKITERDLEQRGPGLVLDHGLDGGARLIVWTE